MREEAAAAQPRPPPLFTFYAQTASSTNRAQARLRDAGPTRELGTRLSGHAPVGTRQFHTRGERGTNRVSGKVWTGMYWE